MEGSTESKKLAGWDFYRTVLGGAKFIVAPMVDQSELAYRRLVRRYGAQVVYTPMINAKMFMDERHSKTFRDSNFDVSSGEEGHAEDRPLIIQFCANSPSQLLAAAKILEPHCDAVDINLGCPQEIARKGHCGAFLMEDWDLIYEMINNLHRNLSVPVTAKFRVYPSIERTVAYAQMLERAGAQILTCHGRMREQRGQNTGLASFSHIRAVKQAVSVPVFANGNILFGSDVARCLRETGADAVMSAEGVLYNPALFRGLNPDNAEQDPDSADLEYTNPRHADLALEYLATVGLLKTRTAVSAVKGHLFKLMRPALVREKDLREKLGKTLVNSRKPEEGFEEYKRICEEMKRRMDRDAEIYTEGGRVPLSDLIMKDPATGLHVLPHWLAQPYFRPPPSVKR